MTRKETVNKAICSPDISIREALKSLNSCEGQILLVVDKDNKLIGTITDGDIRRPLLRNMPLSTPVSEIMRRNPLTLHSSEVKYISYKDRIVKLFKNRNMKYSILTNEDILSYKKSDTIFILASGSSINNLTNKQWQVIANYDSFGLNYWLVHWHVPTFYSVEYSRYEYNRKMFKKVFAQSERRKKYSLAPFFVSSRDKKRGLHPLFTPELLPQEPKIFYFPYPKVVTVPNTRKFQRSDFAGFTRYLRKKNIMYRGTLSIVLGLVCQLGYQNIVILGVDLKDNRYFYDNYEEMTWFRNPEIVGQEMSYDRLHGTMLPKGGKHPISEYIYALNECCLIPNGINLYVGDASVLLAERLKLYHW